jgi:hypothetical protein
MRDPGDVLQFAGSCSPAVPLSRSSPLGSRLRRVCLMGRRRHLGVSATFHLRYHLCRFKLLKKKTGVFTSIYISI